MKERAGTMTAPSVGTRMPESRSRISWFCTSQLAERSERRTASRGAHKPSISPSGTRPSKATCTPTPVAVKSSVVDVECLGVGESTSGAAPREARHTPAAPAPRTPHLDDPLSFEEYGDHHTDDRRGESVL